jgi:hypothetical protein
MFARLGRTDRDDNDANLPSRYSCSIGDSGFVTEALENRLPQKGQTNANLFDGPGRLPRPFAVYDMSTIHGSPARSRARAEAAAIDG